MVEVPDEVKSTDAHAGVPVNLTLPAGTILGDRYRIDRKIGSGGMGTVYAAWHIPLRRPVALKVLSRAHSLDPTYVKRFRREARICSQARHPNIVEVIDLGQAEGHEYLAMELLEGLDLADAITMKGTYDPVEMIPVIDQVLAALEVAHGFGVIHRDLKPENVYLAQSPAHDVTIKLLDFGVVKVLDEGAQAHLTRTGSVVGTPEYM